MKEFTQLMQAQFNKMCASGKLFRSNLTGNQIWDLYISSFEKENDPIFRDPESSTHNCNHCKNFIRRYGNIVVIDKNYDIITMFDFVAPKEFDSVVKTMSKAIKAAPISNVFFEPYEELNSLPYEKCNRTNPVFRLGIDKNVKQYTELEARKFGVVSPGQIMTFTHMHLSLPKTYVDFSGKSIEAITSEYRDSKNVFKRAMDEISEDTLQLVKELILQGSLLDGQTHLYKVEQFIPFAKEYKTISENKKDNWCWVKSYQLQIAKFKNELIGVLCSELAEGIELNDACQSWNKRVDPANYMKATAPITKKQIEDARKFVEENGYVESFNRRFATIDDIKASEIHHINIGDGSIKPVSIFDGVKSTSTRHKRSEFEGIEEVSIEKFMKDILPTCSSVEVFLANNHERNMVSITTSNVKDSKPIFKWSNNYSWTFNGNLAGKSQIKEAVKTRGGNVNGVLRFSIMWAENDPTDNSDLDAHAYEPNGTHIYYASYRGNSTSMSGTLDVDITRPNSLGNKNIIENIVWTNINSMKNGKYKLLVNQFANRGSKGFKAEIEFNGEIYNYEYNRPLIGSAIVAEVTLNNGEFSIKHILPEAIVSSKDIYGLTTNAFHKVNLVCVSPNHWDGSSIGNKHYFFMLDKCKCPIPIRSFHIENLIPELAQHRKVLEVLGNTTMIEPADKQLSGLGFNATVRDELIVRLQGSFKRVIKIKF